MGDLLQYREELAEEDVDKFDSVEIGVLRLEGAMAIMKVMRMADEDELRVRRARLPAERNAVALKAEEAMDAMDAMAILQSDEREMDGVDFMLPGDEEKVEDGMNVLQIDEQANSDAVVDALAEIQHEEKRAESAEGEFQDQLQAQIQRDVQTRSRSEERQLREEKETPAETAPTKKMEEVKGKGRSEERQSWERKNPSHRLLRLKRASFPIRLVFNKNSNINLNNINLKNINAQIRLLCAHVQPRINSPHF